MEILLSAPIITVITEAVKFLTNKFGKETTAVIIYVVGAVASVGYTAGMAFADGTLAFDASFFTQAAAIWTGSIGIYEVIVKKMIKPALNKVSTK